MKNQVGKVNEIFIKDCSKNKPATKTVDMKGNVPRNK